MKNEIKNTKFLDGLRGFAAIYVLIFHCRWLLSENYFIRLKSNLNIYQKILLKLFSFFRFGHEMVIFFFVLSGFVIHYSTTNKKMKLSEIKINWVSFFKKRINRIYPPFILALIITALIDFIGKNTFSFSNYTQGSKYYSMIIDSYNFSPKIFFCNLMNLQTFIIPPFGSNGALWSLSYEWWFYLLYPLFYVLHTKSPGFVALFQVILFLLFSGIFFTVSVPILTLLFQKMIIWWLGVLLADIYIGRIKLSFKYLTFLTLGIPLAILLFYNNRIIGDIFWGIGFSGIISFLFCVSNSSIVIKLIDKIRFTGKFSYTLYLIHLPIVYFFHGYLIDKNHGNLPLSYFWVFAVSTVIVLISFVLAPKIEKVKLFTEK